MKTALRFFVTVALAATFALPAFAQDAQADNEARAALYQKFVDNRGKKDAAGNPDAAAQKAAYEQGKDYLAKYSNLPDEDNKKIVEYIQKWVKRYEKAAREYNFSKAIDSGDFRAALPPAREELAEDPDNVRVNLQLARTGYLAITKGDKTLTGDVLNYVRKALQLIESGKTADSWAPYGSKDDALGFLRYMEGFLLIESQPDTAVKSFIKAAQSNSAASREPSTYDALVFVYTKEYQRAAADYQKRFPDGTEITPELKPEYDRLQVQLNKIADRIIDAQARVVALTQKPDDKNKLMVKLTAIYKNRHENSDAGLRELIAGILSKPIMIPGQEPEPVMPAPTTTTTTTAPTTGGQTSQTTPASTTRTAPGTPAKPDAKPKPNNTAPTGARPPR